MTATKTNTKQSVIDQALEVSKTLHDAVEDLAAKVCDESHQLTGDEWRIVSMAGLDREGFERRVIKVGKIREFQADAGTAKERTETPKILAKMKAENQTRSAVLRQEIEERQNELQRLTDGEQALLTKIEKSQRAIEVLRDTQQPASFMPDHRILEYNARRKTLRDHPDFKIWKQSEAVIDKPHWMLSTTWVNEDQGKSRRLLDSSHGFNPQVKSSHTNDEGFFVRKEHFDEWKQRLQRERDEAQQWLDANGERMQKMEDEIESLRDLYVPQ